MKKLLGPLCYVSFLFVVSSRKFNRILFSTFLIVFLSSGKVALCQQFDNVLEQTPVPHLYLGIGLGVNEYGFGLNLEVPFNNHLSINGTAGFGGWGWKLGGNLNYYPFDITGGNEFSVGFSGAGGLQDFSTTLTIEPNGDESMVNLDLNPVNTINLIYSYNLKAGRSFKIAFSAGYAICISRDTYNVNSSVTLDHISRQVLNIMEPGGLILGMKFLFGLK